MSETYVLVGGQRLNTADWKFPDDRHFRDAWESDNKRGTIVIDMEMAKEIWRDKIRQARIKPLLDLDAKFMKALETGKDTSEIVKAKQVLRDAPQDPRIELAKTPAALIKILPDGLEIE